MQLWKGWVCNQDRVPSLKHNHRCSAWETRPQAGCGGWLITPQTMECCNTELVGWLTSFLWCVCKPLTWDVPDRIGSVKCSPHLCWVCADHRPGRAGQDWVCQGRCRSQSTAQEAGEQLSVHSRCHWLPVSHACLGGLSRSDAAEMSLAQEKRYSSAGGALFNAAECQIETAVRCLLKCISCQNQWRHAHTAAHQTVPLPGSATCAAAGAQRRCLPCRSRPVPRSWLSGTGA